MHTRKDVGQSGLAHPLLPYEHHPVVGFPGLGGDDGVCGVRGPAPAAVVLIGGRVMATLAVPGGLFLDHQMPAVGRDAPALLLWLRAHSALAHGDIVQSHGQGLESKVAKVCALVSMNKSSLVSNTVVFRDILSDGANLNIRNPNETAPKPTGFQRDTPTHTINQLLRQTVNLQKEKVPLTSPTALGIPPWDPPSEL